MTPIFIFGASVIFGYWLLRFLIIELVLLRILVTDCSFFSASSLLYRIMLLLAAPCMSDSDISGIESCDYSYRFTVGETSPKY